MDLSTLSDRFVLALTVWGESRGEPVEGQIAVASVVKNRLMRHGATSTRWADICLAPGQFSCFNVNDPNRQAIERAATMLLTAALTPELHQAVWIADGVIAGAAKDNTKGATHYLVTSLLKTLPPSWAKGQSVLTVIGAHSFLRVA